jgi:hypothetical protein
VPLEGEGDKKFWVKKKKEKEEMQEETMMRGIKSSYE